MPQALHNLRPDAGQWETSTVLVVTPQDDDATAIANCFSNPRFRVKAARSCTEARKALSAEPITAVMAEADLPDGSWRDILDFSRDSDNPPLLIVTSYFADERLWAEVLNMGGYDVLQKPYNRQEIQRVLGMATHQWAGRRKPADSGITNQPARFTAI